MTAEEQKEDLIEAQNGEPASACPDIPNEEVQLPSDPSPKQSLRHGIVLRPWHLLLGSFLIITLLTGAILLGMWLVKRDHDPSIEENVKVYNDIHASAADVAAGNFAAPGYSEITFPAGKRDVQIILPNPVGNPCYFRYTLVLEDTGEILYQSGLIEPGKAVTDIRLARPLEVGDYALKILIETASTADRSAMNGIRMDVVLKVR